MSAPGGGSITLSGSLESMAYLRSLKRGTEVPARIVEVKGPRSAVIEMGGRNIEAEFHEGVPRADAFILSLKEKSGTSFVFRMNLPGPLGDPIGEFSSFTVFNARTLAPQALVDAFRALRDRTTGLFDINLFLMKRFRGEGGPAARLASGGLSRNALGDILLLGMARTYGAHLAALAALFPPLKERVPEESGIEEMLKRILKEVDTIIESNGSGDIARYILDLLQGREEPGAQYHFYDFSRDGDGGGPRMLAADGNVIVEADYSSLGRVTVLARLDGGLHLSLFAGAEGPLDALRKADRDLRKDLRASGLQATVNYLLAGDGINKMIEIIDRGLVYSVLDVRV